MSKLVANSLLALVLAGAPFTAAFAQPVSEGSWIWVKRPAGDAAHQNQSSFRVNADLRNGRYCYNGKCFNVALVSRGNTYTFSSNGINFFEFESPSPGEMIGRHWLNSGNTGAPPDAVVRMFDK